MVILDGDNNNVLLVRQLCPIIHISVRASAHIATARKPEHHSLWLVICCMLTPYVQDEAVLAEFLSHLCKAIKVGDACGCEIKTCFRIRKEFARVCWGNRTGEALGESSIVFK